MEAFFNLARPCEDMHHHSYFLPNFEKVEVNPKIIFYLGDLDWFECPILTQDVFVEANLANILKITLINISIKPCIIKSILIGIDCSSQEIEE